MTKKIKEVGDAEGKLTKKKQGWRQKKMSGVKNINQTKEDDSRGRVFWEGQADRRRNRRRIFKKQSTREKLQTIKILLGQCFSNLSVQAVTWGHC